MTASSPVSNGPVQRPIPLAGSDGPSSSDAAARSFHEILNGLQTSVPQVASRSVCREASPIESERAQADADLINDTLDHRMNRTQLHKSDIPFIKVIGLEADEIKEAASGGRITERQGPGKPNIDLGPTIRTSLNSARDRLTSTPMGDDLHEETKFDATLGFFRIPHGPTPAETIKKTVVSIDAALKALPAVQSQCP